MHENRFNEYRIPSGMLIVFLEKALTLIHMETHLDDVSSVELEQNEPLSPVACHACLSCPGPRGVPCRRAVIERDLSERFLN